MQTLIISGRVGRDAELRHTQGGDPILGFSVAVDNGKDKSGQRRDATWYDASIWGKRAEALAPYITKGMSVTLRGRPGAREYNGKIYMQISVDDLTMHGGGSGGGDNHQPRQESQRPPAQRDLDDEIPF